MVSTRKVLVALTIVGVAFAGLSFFLDSGKKEEKKPLPESLDFSDLGDLGSFSIAETKGADSPSSPLANAVSGPAFFGPEEERRVHDHSGGSGLPLFPANVKAIPNSIDGASSLKTAQFESNVAVPLRTAWLTGTIEEVAD